MGSRTHSLHGFSVNAKVDQDFIPGAGLSIERPALRGIRSGAANSQALMMRKVIFLTTVR